MSQCSIYIPGLLGPDVPIEAFDQQAWPGIKTCPYLAKLLTHGHYSAMTKVDIESRILNGLGITFSADADVPMAYLRSQQIPHVTAQSNFWCLDPVFIQIDKEDAVICAHESIDLDESEARYLIEDLNTHFAEDGFKLHYHSTHRWVLEAELELVTSSLTSVFQKNLSQLQPTGATEKQWRTLQNEIQMLLFNHPINQAREERGDVTVNSLWLWGGGEPEQYERVVESVFCDESWVNDIAQLYEIDSHTVDNFAKLTRIDKPCLLIYSELFITVRSNDVFAWLDGLAHFEDKILSRAMDMLAKGSLDHLSVYSDTVSISLQKKDLKKWWRRDKPVRDSVLKARHDYGV